MLKAIMPTIDSRLQYVDGIDARGEDFFRVVCENDLEGIVAKPKQGIYHTNGLHTNWLKIKNPSYSQMVNRADLFDEIHKRSRRSPRPPRLLLPSHALNFNNR